MMITPNFSVAIRHLRSAVEIQVLWIDSICTDQEAVLERNGQVALMGEIYKSAAKVIIWLGQGNERVEAAIREVTEFAHIAQSGDVGYRRGINHANRRATQAALRDRLKHISSSKLLPTAGRIIPLTSIQVSLTRQRIHLAHLSNVPSFIEFGSSKNSRCLHIKE
jgi:hypothetical protein